MQPTVTDFNEILWGYYTTHGRHDLSWRQPAADGSFDPYKIMVSELMLQQTQVTRVIPKFHEFLTKFPDLHVLATSDLAAVLRVWSGLGYNRRAKFLWRAAKRVVNDFNGNFPRELDSLVSLPGIGRNTAGAIQAYAFNKPSLFIETNIRTVYIHHFFTNQTAVTDKSIASILQLTLDQEQPREYYWALMDYGSYLKQTIGNVGKFSTLYTKQSKFAGSRRQIRGQVLRLLAGRNLTTQQLTEHIIDERLESVLNDLVNEKLIKKDRAKFHL